jgi:cellulose synthase/poly-beta-1,6-N-acetylglucosamine synthase-like glycosyltransferase/peptidoglycan/xylan/chitin deacetylase (PgdA/CDA1 family)
LMPQLSIQSGQHLQVMNLVADSTSRTKLANQLSEQIDNADYHGVTIDFNGIESEYREAFTAFVSELSTVFSKNGFEVASIVTTDSETYDYAALSEFADRIIVNLYGEHYETTKPGPLASNEWTQKTLNELPIPEEQLIISLGNYGYDWKLEKTGETEELQYLKRQDVMKLASENNIDIQWDESSGNPYLRYMKNSQEHIVWFLDGVTFYNQLRLALGHGIKGVAISTLGYEEPSVWEILQNTDQMDHYVKELKHIDTVLPMINEGQGEMVNITSTTNTGLRQLELDENGFIQAETYEQYPVPHYVERYGKPSDKKITISFDDGPNPKYTPQILDILSEKGVRANFFIVGKQAALHPDIVERMHREGHEVGSHTFTHSNIMEDSPLTLQMELNSTQWLIQQITGHSTSLFRPPFTTDVDYSFDELENVDVFQNMGYTFVGSLIDSRDWESQSTSEIVHKVMNSLDGGNIILFHDSGGNRSATIEALPIIVDQLRDNGYELVPASGLAGKTRSDFMQPVSEGTNFYMAFYKMAGSIYIFLATFIKWFFIIGIALGILRLLFLLFFSMKHNRKYKARTKLREMNPDFAPFVSVIIPAYNEEKVIKNTIDSILKSDYANFEIVFVDDGSTDNTVNVVAQHFKQHPKVRLIKKSNGGKPSAINKGCSEAKGDIIIIFDADTSIAENAISLLVSHFVDEKVAAVAGNVKIGNVRNLITMWQHVEYVSGANLEKRAFDELNCITVVPGAIGAWRKDAIAEIGYFEDDTLAEDTDVTLKLLRKGHRVTFEPNANAYTEAPENMKSFIKQRFRWTYGIFQCMWKHRGSLFNPKQKSLGFVGLPNMWFQYVIQGLAPLADLFFIFGLLFGDGSMVLGFYLGFFIVDYLVALYTFKLERVSAKPLLLLFIQRFVYRQFFTYTIWKSIILALRGVLVGWNKLKRSGHVQLPEKQQNTMPS